MKKINKASGIFSLKLVAILLAMNSLQMSAKSPNELSIYGGGGFSAFHCQPSLSGSSSGGFSGDLGGAFTAFVSSQVGFHVGAGLGIYSIENKVKELYTYTPDLRDDNNYIFDLHTTLFNYRETHRTFYLSIPLMLHVQSNMNRSWNRRQNQDIGFYLLTGIKANILFSRKYESEVGSLFNTAYYQYLDNWAATQKFEGLGLFDETKNTKGTLDFGILAMFTIEAGPKWVLSNNMLLYTGVYFDYGLIDPSKGGREPVEKYTYPKDLENLPLLAYTDKMNLMTIGLKVRLAFARNTSPYDCPRGF